MLITAVPAAAKRIFIALYVYFTGKNESGQTSLAIDA
jgi:hypothetical protein